MRLADATRRVGSEGILSRRACEVGRAADTHTRSMGDIGSSVSVSGESGSAVYVIPVGLRLGVFCVILMHFCPGAGRALPRENLAISVALGRG